MGSPRLTELYQRLERARQSLGGGNRWGETRRFAGRAAGNRLAKVVHIQSMIDKEYKKLQAGR